MATFEMHGLDKLQKDLKKLQENAKKLEGNREVPFSELFTASFMSKYTPFPSIDELLDAGGFHAETSEDFEAIPEDALDAHIAATTKFKSWDDMVGEATQEYITKQLGL